MHAQGLQEVVTDKGYHSDASLQTIEAMEVRSYVPFPHRSGTGRVKQTRRQRSRPISGA